VVAGRFADFRGPAERLLEGPILGRERAVDHVISKKL
jgi:hypothetical protein